MTGDVYAVWAVGDVGGVEVEAGEVGSSSGTVNDEVGGDRRLVTVVVEGDVEAVTGGSDVDDLGGAMDVDADGVAAGDEEFDEVGVEATQRAGAVVGDHCLGAGTRRDVGELEGDESAADEQDPFGELFEVEESGGVDEVFGAGEVERSGSGAGGDQGVPEPMDGAVDVEPVRIGEACGAVQGDNVVAGEAGFHVGGDRIREAVHVGAERGPVDGESGGVDALAGEEVGGVDDLGTSSQDLLRVAAAQSARAAVGEVIDDRDPPAGPGTLLGGGAAGHPGTDHDQVEGIRRAHRVPTRVAALRFRVRWMSARQHFVEGLRCSHAQ